MSIRILYFARLREDMGIAGEMFELPGETCDVNSLRAQLIARGGASAAALGSGQGGARFGQPGSRARRYAGEGGR